ncbi:hypothetical protein RGUI_2980 [Rhodovulum sp. P5]|nr:hypothetical protein [Rhodovulum sp. P5]ARE41121.1 hypothetical protein RGUI_2980 [Rhodovulum sp. P5]
MTIVTNLDTANLIFLALFGCASIMLWLPIIAAGVTATRTSLFGTE